MSFQALDATSVNIMDSFCKDAIGRNYDVCRFVTWLNELDTHCSIAIGAPWGAGKTFFVKQVKLVLEAYNEFACDFENDEKITIKKLYESFSGANGIQLQPQVCVYYDAWINDNETDPIISLIYSIVSEVATDYSFKKNNNLTDVLTGIVDLVTGRDSTKMVEALKRKDLFEEIKARKDFYELVSEFLDSLLPERGNRLVVIIDELDRCRPDFAVRFLERIKHYFANDRITFVFSVNTAELQHTIKRFYGAEFNAARYLDRFFDFAIELPPENEDRFFSLIGMPESTNVFDGICKRVASVCGMSMREKIRFCNMAKLTVGAKLKTMNCGIGYDMTFQFSTVIFLPLLLALKIVDRDMYERFIAGDDDSLLYKVFVDDRLAISFFGGLLENDETYKTDSSEGTKVTVKDKLSKAYRYLFNKSFVSGYDGICIGAYCFTAKIRRELFNILSALSRYAEYSLEEE